MVGQHRIGLVTICSNVRFEKLWPVWGMISSLLLPKGKVYVYEYGKCELEENVGMVKG